MHQIKSANEEGQPLLLDLALLMQRMSAAA